MSDAAALELASAIRRLTAEMARLNYRLDLAAARKREGVSE